MSDDTDLEAARALQLLPAPDHRPGFWEDLESQLRRPDYVHPIEPARRSRRPLSWLVASAAAAVVVAAIVVIGGRLRGDDAPTIASQPPTSTAASTSASTFAGPPTTSGSAASPPTAEEARAIDAVKRFVEALSIGDTQTAATLIGARSEEYLTAQSGSVAAYFDSQRDELRAWGQLLDRHIQAVTVRPGDVVVVFEGAVPTTTEALPAAFAIPARQFVSADAWVAEPWAFDRQAGGTIGLQSPDPQPVVPPLARGSSIEVSVPQAGQVWFGLDDDPLTQVATRSSGNGATARWTPANVSPGPHVLIVVFQNDDQTTYSALSRFVEAT